MKQGISLFSFTDSTDVRWMFEHAKKAGYDGVEPVMSESGYLNPATPEKDILAMRRMAEDIGLEIPSVGVWSLWENNLVSDNPAIREKAFGIVERQIEAAHLLGADTILVVPGYVGCSFASKPEKIRYDVAYARSQEAVSYTHLDVYKRQGLLHFAVQLGKYIAGVIFGQCTEGEHSLLRRKPCLLYTSRGQVCRGGILERLAPRPLCLADGPAQARGGLCRVAEQRCV